MSFKFADEVIDEIKTREQVEIPDGSVSGEEFEEWLRSEKKTENKIEESHMLNQEEIDKLSIDDQLRHIMIDTGSILLSTRIAYMYCWEAMRKLIDKYISLRPKMNQLCADFANLSTEEVISNLTDKEDYDGCKETVKSLQNITDRCTEIMDDLEQNMGRYIMFPDLEYHELLDKVTIFLNTQKSFSQTRNNIDDIKDIILSKWFDRIDSIIDSILDESADSNYKELLFTYEPDINADIEKLLNDIEAKISDVHPEDELDIRELRMFSSVLRNINN